MAESPSAIVVAYNGSTHPDASRAYDKLETHIREKYPDAALRRVFLSEKILEKIADETVDSLSGALEKLALEKYQAVSILPGMVFAGETYVMMMMPLMVFGEVFSGGVSLYRPLIDWEFDCRTFAQTMLEEMSENLKKHDKLILLSHSAHPTLKTLEQEFNKLNDNILLVTLDELDDLDSVRAKLPSGSKVLIKPLMIAGGVHVHRDMRGKLVSPLEANGFECTPILKGLCEYDSVCKLLVSHIIPG